MFSLCFQVPLGCMRRLGVENLLPLVLEIEETLRKIRKDKREVTQTEQPMDNMNEFRGEEVGSRMRDGTNLDTAQLDNVLRLIRDYSRPPSTIQPVIRRLAIQATNFELKSITLQLQGVQFIGLPHEDPNLHILNFLEVGDTAKYNEVCDDAIRLQLFPFYLKGKAKHWLTREPPDSITTWDKLVDRFLTQFFPPAKAAKLRININNFCQLDGESFYEAWAF